MEDLVRKSLDREAEQVNLEPSSDIGSPPAAANMPHLIRAGQPDAMMIVFPKDAKPSGH
jgi:hypothetical protein